MPIVGVVVLRKRLEPGVIYVDFRKWKKIRTAKHSISLAVVDIVIESMCMCICAHACALTYACVIGNLTPFRFSE